MWHTSAGDRILSGQEARLFKAAVTDLVEDIKDESSHSGEPWQSGVALFDELVWSQKLALLDNVATHLLTNAGRMPELTAVNEAAVGAIYAYVVYCIDFELELDSRQRWRHLVFNACLESFSTEMQSPDDPDEPALPRTADSCDADGWHHAVESLTDLILWDRDYEMVSEFMDESPEKAALLRQIMGIDDDYFASAADDLHTPEEVTATFDRLAAVLK